MARNIVICCDGTNNEFGPENTNVVRLIQSLDRDPQKQILYYDPGVGTLPEPHLFTSIGKTISKWFGLAFGTGLVKNVEEAYSYLMDFWEKGDRVFLFGFSRGAYTARVLAALLHSLGLLPRGNYNLVPYVLRLFAAVKKAGPREGNETESNYWELCKQFRETFARLPTNGSEERRFPVHFLGVWDTVSSVGWVWDPVKYPHTAKNPSISVIRHAVSIDERRCFFRQNLMQPMGSQDLQERWFPGVHSDVGGGYSEKDGGLWRRPFRWMIDEAEKAGLVIDAYRLETVLKTKPSAKPWTDPQHESLRGLWWLAEFFPKLVGRPGSSFRFPRLGLGRHRFIHDGALMDNSAVRRVRDKPDYKPPNLPEDTLRKIRELQEIPDVLRSDRESSPAP